MSEPFTKASPHHQSGLHTLKFQTAVVKCKPDGTYTGVINWVGGLRFEAFKTEAEAIAWIQSNVAEVRDNFEIVSMNQYWVSESNLIRFLRKE